MAFATLKGVRRRPSLSGSSPRRTSILLYMVAISSMVSAFQVSILLYPSSVNPEPSFTFSIFLTIVFYHIIFCLFNFYTVKLCPLLFNRLLQFVPDSNCQVLCCGNFTFHEIDFNIHIPVIDLHNDLILDYFLQDINIDHKSMIVRRFAFNSNPKHIIVSMPVRIGAFTENLPVFFIRPVLPEHPVRSTESFSACKVDHITVRFKYNNKQ